MKVLSFLIAAALLVSFSGTVNASPKAKTVKASTCYVKKDGVLWSYYTGAVEGDRFFSDMANLSQRERSCVIAKIYSEPYSGRIYVQGRRLAKALGSMSDAEVRQVVRNAGLTGECSRYSCVESRY